MQKMNQRLQNYVMAATAALFVLTGLRFVLVNIRYHQEKGRLEREFKRAETNGITPDVILARRDGKNYKKAEEVAPYAKLINQLDNKCNESAAELIALTSAIVKHENKQGMNLTHLEGLETFLFSVESGFERFPANCMEAYQAHVKTDG